MERIFPCLDYIANTQKKTKNNLTDHENIMACTYTDGESFGGDEGGMESDVLGIISG